VHRPRDDAFQEALVVLAHIEQDHVPFLDLDGRQFYREVLYASLGFGDHLFRTFRLCLRHGYVSSSICSYAILYALKNGTLVRPHKASVRRRIPAYFHRPLPIWGAPVRRAARSRRPWRVALASRISSSWRSRYSSLGFRFP
jgi:hypothetical protein